MAKFVFAFKKHYDRIGDNVTKDCELYINTNQIVSIKKEGKKLLVSTTHSPCDKYGNPLVEYEIMHDVAVGFDSVLDDLFPLKDEPDYNAIEGLRIGEDNF